MKYKFFMLIIVMCIFCSVFFVDTSKNETVPATDNIASLIENTEENLNEYIVDASYGDSAESFDELEKEAKYIVTATVISVEKTKVSQKAVLKVSNVLKGKDKEEIELYQILGDDNVLLNKEYILFLNEQTPEDTNTDDFYPVAGGRGIMCVESKTSTIEIDSQKLNSDSLTAWLNDNLKDKSRNAKEYTVVVRSE